MLEMNLFFKYIFKLIQIALQQICYFFMLCLNQYFFKVRSQNSFRSIQNCFDKSNKINYFNKYQKIRNKLFRVQAIKSRKHLNVIAQRQLLNIALQCWSFGLITHQSKIYSSQCFERLPWAGCAAFSALATSLALGAEGELGTKRQVAQFTCGWLVTPLSRYIFMYSIPFFLAVASALQKSLKSIQHFFKLFCLIICDSSAKQCQIAFIFLLSFLYKLAALTLQKNLRAKQSKEKINSPQSQVATSP
eukprot:TRINITY_DN18260_c0_g1_i5.p1 TRINITY_DN18260_c0_g1~~TRINITY_DN18260_c0_g1_i5.p1  ORF type:complete len:247 (-),score=-14.03 TRINITY_DN18260_c0_g1_i5:222-962(-)